ncbi:MAG: CatB-related O-acetyltransferase [Lachnospiraceae bacterium]|nr:CatB-related O-acetyltransferase [Lachnospiraceae bacterium]
MNLTEICIPPDTIRDTQHFYTRTENGRQLCYMTVGRGSYIVEASIDDVIEFTLKDDYIIHNVQIGKFCSIARNLKIMLGRNHNYHLLSTGVSDLWGKAADDQAEAEKTNFHQKGMVLIQNDVWIGKDVSIMSGVTIHNGAVIAAGSHVVKDVPPYAIVGGNPAKIIGYRFEEEIIQMLLQIKWWDWEPEKIKQNAKWFHDDVREFCEIFIGECDAKPEQETVAGGEIKSTNNQYVTGIVADFDDNYPVYIRVLDEFLEHFIYDDRKLLFLIKREFVELYQEEIMELAQIADKVNGNEKIQCSVDVVLENDNSLEELVRNANELILTRGTETVYLSCLSDEYQKPYLSGVDMPIW